MADRQPYVAAGVVVLLVVLAGLFYYKWGGAIGTVGVVRATREWTRPTAELTSGQILIAMFDYFRVIWIALVFGLAIGAVVHAFVPPARLAAILAGRGPVRRQLAGGLSGAPLMLCSCCVAPVFSGVYERGAPLGSALGVMLASPGLNPAALALTFILFPADLALARLAAAVAAVFVLPPIVERMAGRTVTLRRAPPADWPDDQGPTSVRDFALRFGRSFAYLTALTLPLLAVGVVLSSLVLPLSFQLSTGGTLFAVALVAAIAVLVALPTFFEIPLALALLHLGAPGAAAAMLVAGPIVNLPSLLVLARATELKLAATVAAGVWLLALAAAAAVQLV